MRRWIGMIAAGGALALALAGCGNPGGVDGALTDDWAAVPEPVAFTPAAGTCHPSFEPVGTLRAYQPVECAQPHETETLHLGMVTGADAARDTPPAAGSAGRRALRADCAKKVNELLGGDWRSARIALTVVLPSADGWRGGARWYRCDVHEAESIDTGSPVKRSGSLRGALEGTSELAHACFRPKLIKDDIDKMEPVACTTKHRSEFAGIWTGPDVSYATLLKDSDRVHKGCRGVVAGYAKLPNDGDLQFRVGTIYYLPHEEDWKDGDRGVQCLLWMSDRDLTRQMKGAGTSGFPINFE